MVSRRRARTIGPCIAPLPDDRWSEIRAALLSVLGFEDLADDRND
jgi:hypothetical protein